MVPRGYNLGIPDPECFTPGLNPGIVSQIPNPVLQSRDPEIFVLCLSYSTMFQQ